MVARTPRERVEDFLRESPGLIPCSVAIVVLLWWAAADGGFDPLTWLPGSLVLLGVTAAYVLAAPGGYRGGKVLGLAMLAFAAFVCWSFLSTAWSETPALAWAGSNLTLAYFLVFVLFAWRAFSPTAAAGLIGLYALGVGVIGLVTTERIAASGNPLEFFIAGRLASPINYPNANCALFLSGAIPALVLASRREVHWLVRGLLVSAAGVLAELALMSQSRASLVALPVTLVLLLAFVPGRIRFVLTVVPVAAVVAAVGARPVLRTYEAVVSGSDLTRVLGDARLAILGTAALLFVAGSAMGLIDRSVRVPRRIKVAAGVAIIGVGLAGIAAASAVFVQRYDPLNNASIWWDRFSGGSYLYEADTPHLVSGLGSGRYDIWRVAVDVFERDVIVGAGVDTFGADYLRLRTRLDDPVYTHSIELRTLEGTGVIGALLLLSAFGAAGIVATRGARSTTEFGRAVLVAAFGVVTYWLVHGSVDWFWEMPILGASAFACMGILASIGSPRTRDRPTNADPFPKTVAGTTTPVDSPSASVGRRTHRQHVRTAVLGLAMLACGTSLMFPWLSARDVQAASHGWVSDPAGAFARLDRARSLNPLSDEPDIYAAVIAAQLGDTARQRASLERAIQRNPLNWYSHLALGALDAREGRRKDGLRELELAAGLDPLEPTIAMTIERVRAGRPPSEAEIEEMLVSRVDLLVGKRQG